MFAIYSMYAYFSEILCFSSIYILHWESLERMGICGPLGTSFPVTLVFEQVGMQQKRYKMGLEKIGDAEKQVSCLQR